jgi:hypothetical protein
MTPSTHLRHRILQHLLVGGATLSVGCIAESGPRTDDASTRDAAPQDARPDATEVEDASAPVDMHSTAAEPARVQVEDLEPMPASSGPCDDRFCIQALDDDTCPAQEDVHRELEGSGCCQDGPFGPYSADNPAERPCCYQILGDQCEGRPFLVNHTERLAPTVHRTDWC